MIRKYSVLFFIFLFSCTNNNSMKDEMILHQLPSGNLSSVSLAVELESIKRSIEQVDYESVLSRLDNEAARIGFRKQMIELRDAYNKCVDKVIEIDRAKEEGHHEKVLEFNELKIELDTIWKYIINNYRI